MVHTMLGSMPWARMLKQTVGMVLAWHALNPEFTSQDGVTQAYTLGIRVVGKTGYLFKIIFSYSTARLRQPGLHETLCQTVREGEKKGKWRRGEPQVHRGFFLDFNPSARHAEQWRKREARPWE